MYLIDTPSGLTVHSIEASREMMNTSTKTHNMKFLMITNQLLLISHTNNMRRICCDEQKLMKHTA